MRLSHGGDWLRSVTLLFADGAGGSDPQQWSGTISRSNARLLPKCAPSHIFNVGKCFWNSPLTYTHCRAPVGCCVQHHCCPSFLSGQPPLPQGGTEQPSAQLWRDESSEIPSPLILLVLDIQLVQQGPCHPSERKKITTVIRCKPNRSHVV